LNNSRRGFPTVFFLDDLGNNEIVYDRKAFSELLENEKLTAAS
jgi:hypothetical protein